ncbi:MAG: hypothetical protein WBN94_02970 [Methanothrix sp.]
MKRLIAILSMLLFVFAAQVFGLAYGTEEAAANDSTNTTQINETFNNTIYINGTLENATFIIANVSLENVTLINATLENTSLAQNESESDPFADAKNRKPSNR